MLSPVAASVNGLSHMAVSSHGMLENRRLDASIDTSHNYRLKMLFSEKAQSQH
jgi:hypothetical protein